LKINALLSLSIISVLTLLVSGAMMSLEKMHEIMLTFHRISTPLVFKNCKSILSGVNEARAVREIVKVAKK